MFKRILAITVMIVGLTGCQYKHIMQEEQHSEIEEFQTQENFPEQLTNMDIYSSLDELYLAFEAATSSNARSKISDDRVYYLVENNDSHLLLEDIRVREGYFNCTYNSGICIYTHRLENGAIGLETLTANNPDIFTKEQDDGFEYYYASDEDYKYFLWLQDGYSVQLNVPYNIDINLEDIINNLTYMSIG